MKASFWHRTRRRPSFWLGLFVACFLAWAWWDCYRVDTHLGFSGEEDVFAFVLSKGQLSFYFAIDAAGPDNGFYFHRDSTGDETLTMRELANLLDYPRWGLPASLVFFSFVGFWGGWLVWRWRGERMEVLKAGAA